MADEMVGDVPPRAVEQAMQGAAQPVFKVWARQMAVEDALERIGRALVVAEATQSPVAVGHVEYSRGLVQFAAGDVEAGSASFREVASIGRSHDVPALVASVLPTLIGMPGRSGLESAMEVLDDPPASGRVGHEFVVLEGVGINFAELGQADAAAIVLGHLEPGGRRRLASRARRDAAVASLSGQRRTRRLLEQGAAMSRAEVLDFTRERVRRSLASA